MHGGWRLGMAKFLKGQLYYANLFGIHEECAKLYFSGGGRDEFCNVAQGVNGALEADWCIVAGYRPEEVMACGATFCTSFSGIGRFLVDVQHHGCCLISQCGIWMCDKKIQQMLGDI